MNGVFKRMRMKENEFRISFPLGKFNFECNNCAGCCKKTDAVQLTKKDYRKINSTAKDKSKFLEKAPILKNYPYEAFPYVMKGSGNCVFLKNKLCEIWENKPLRCDLYPLILGIDFEKKILINLERCPALLAEDGIKIDEKFVDNAIRLIEENLDLERYMAWWERQVLGREKTLLDRKRLLLKIIELMASKEIDGIASNLGFYERLYSLWNSNFLADLYNFIQGQRMKIEDLYLVEDALIQELTNFLEERCDDPYEIRTKGQVSKGSSLVKIKNPNDLYDEEILFEEDIRKIQKIGLSKDALNEVHTYLIEIIERDGYLSGLAGDVEIGFYLKLMKRIVYNLETLSRAYALYGGREKTAPEDVIKATVVVDPGLVEYAKEIAL